MKFVDIVAGVEALSSVMCLASVIMLGILKFLSWVIPFIL